MTKSDRQVILFLTNHFGDFSSHLFGLLTELNKQNANEEQCFAYIDDICKSRNMMVEAFKIMKPEIDRALKETRKPLCKKKS